MITIALSKGRIESNFYKLLLEKNITNKIISPGRSLKVRISDEYELLLVKPVDVIRFVSSKYADIGIVGSDTIEEESNNDIYELIDLKTGICFFALASQPFINLEDINVIATKYPNITRRLINTFGINPSIVRMEGSLEVAPIINYADTIVDLVETGSTLKANGLVILNYLEKISTRVITNVENKDEEQIKMFVKRLER